MAALLAAGLSIVSDSSKVANPPSAKTKPQRSYFDASSEIELADQKSSVSHEHRSSWDATITPAGPQTPVEAHAPRYSGDAQPPGTPNGVEQHDALRHYPHGTPGTPARIVPSWSYPRMNKWRVLAACLVYFGNGMNDSAPGALLPYIERYYNIGYAVVSLIWITNAVGFILAALVNDAIVDRLGRARSLMLSESIMIAGYVIVACVPPFPAVAVAYLFLGLGYGLNLAVNNVFCANLANSTVILGLAHGSYGMGGVVAPIVATSLVSAGVLWARFYIIVIGIRVCCFFFTAWSFWNYEKELEPAPDGGIQLRSDNATVAEAEPQPESNKLRMLGRALRNPTTIIGALFIFAYQGSEVSESGWFISYLIQDRHGDPAKVGYVTSGFWAGITVGRFVLTHAAPHVGESRFVFAMGVGVIVFQIMAWQIPNVVGDSIAVAILGVLLGPIYPCSQTIFMRLLPAEIQMNSISFISSAGSSGGALVPFLIGIVSQSTGTWVLNPICIGFYVLMLGCWLCLPRTEKRKE